MSNINLDELWMLMSKYTFKMEPESLKEDFRCLICNEIMVDACQSLCGCKYCHKCLNEHLSEDSEYCPGLSEDCKVEKLVLGITYHRNTLINKKISKVKVHCPNKCCEFKDELFKMEDHLRLCSKQISECPYKRIGCGEKGSHDKILDHLQDHAWQHTHLLIDYMENMKKDDHKEKKNEDQGIMLENVLNDVKEIKKESKDKEIQMTKLIKEIDSLKKELREKDKNIENQKRQLEDQVKDARIQSEIKMKEMKELNIKEIKNIKEEVSLLKDKLKMEHMQIFAKNSNGKTVTFEVMKRDKVSVIKKKIEEKMGLSPDEQKLVFQGRILEDDKTVDDYNITDQSIINVVQRLSKNTIMKVSIQHGDQNFVVPVNDNTKVRDLKTQVAVKIGVCELPDLVLQHQGRYLEDDMTMLESGLRDNYRIQARINLRGG